MKSVGKPPNGSIQNNQVSTSRLSLFIVLLLAVGLFFRFYNLDRKVYWNDEVWTSLWLSGHSSSEMIEQLFDGRELTSQDLQRYQRLNADRRWTSTITSLAIDHPEQSLLHIVLLRVWAGLCGDSIWVIRSFSALVSLLVFPSVYWLCRELFEAPGTAWIAVALMAVSPFHVLYGQEARPYSLWTATILLSSAALLRAIRQQTWRSWSIYALTATLGFYSHTLFGLVAIAHMAYVAANEPSNGNSTVRSRKALVAYLLTTLVALVAFMPWALVIAGKLQSTEWVGAKGEVFVAAQVGISRLLGRWAVGLSAVFLDVSYDFGNPFKHLLRVPVLILELYASYSLYRHSSRRVWLFVFTLIGTPAVILMLPDLVLGGRSISLPRFLIPCYLGLQLAVAHLLVTQTGSPALVRRKIWQTVSVALILCGVVSCAISSQADAWWNKSFISMYHPQAARIINVTPRPLLISDSSGSNPRNVISLSYLLDPKVRLRLVVDETHLQVPDNSSDVFLFNPSASIRRELVKRGYRIEGVETPAGLWRLVK